MSPWLLMNFASSLLLVSLGSPRVVENTERRLAEAGSSVLLCAPDVKKMNLIEWEFIRDTTSKFILQKYADLQAATIYQAYQGRVVFYPQNGSILLQRLREEDSGIYKATVDLLQDKARTTLLEVIKPVPQPELQCSSNLAGSPIELVCRMPEGTVDSISWRKEGRPLPPEKFSLLSVDMTMLQIRNGDKSDCGFYSCNISNRITWKEATVNLTVTGLTPPLRLLQRLVVVTLIFVTVSATIFIILLCGLRQPGFGNESWKHVILFIHLLLCTSSLLLLASSIIWMQEEGPSAAFILLGLFLFTAVIGAIRAAAAVVWRPAALSHFKTQKWYPLIQNSTVPTTFVVNLLFSVLLLHNIQQLHERGCSEATDLVPSYVSAAVAILLMLLLFLLHWYHRRNQTQNTTEKEHFNHSKEVKATMVLEESQSQKQEEVIPPAREMPE